jgi:hypothetical protein
MATHAVTRLVTELQPEEISERFPLRFLVFENHFRMWRMEECHTKVECRGSSNILKKRETSQ